MQRSYSELSTFDTLEERYEYLKMKSEIGRATFGCERHLNQSFYKSKEWRDVRHKVIVRDEACDLGVKDNPIGGPIYVHHINAITPEDIVNNSPSLVDPDNLICSSRMTHEAIHFGDEKLLPKEWEPRSSGDTKPW